MPVKVNIYKFAFFLGMICLPFTVSSQVVSSVQKSDNKVIIEGKVYFIHVVKPGQTLYAISKAYSVQEKEIALENPGVYSGLQIGQVLKIPFNPTLKLDNNVNSEEGNVIKHELLPGQTLYQLSKMYNVPVGEIEKRNPDLDHSHIPIGTIILIPPHSITKEEDSYYYHKVRRRETIYSLSKQYEVDRSEIYRNNPELEITGLKTGQIIRIPRLVIAGFEDTVLDTMITEAIADSTMEIEKADTFSFLDYKERMKEFHLDRLHVAFLIPFDYYPEMAIDSVNAIKEGGKTEVNPEEERMKKLPKSVNFLEFFEGSIMAIEKLKKEGFRVDVRYYDTRKSPAKVKEILATDFMQNVDLIIGPFYSWNVEIVNEFSKEKGVPLISPFYDESDLTEKNPFLFQMNPSYQLEFNAASKILAQDFDKNFLFIHGIDSLNMKKVDYFKSSLLKDMSSFTHEENIVLKELVYENAAKSDLSQDLLISLSKDKKNIVVIPETNEAFVSNLITQLYFQLRNFDIEVFGMPHFYGFDNVEQQYFHSLNLRFVSPYYFSYSDSTIADFLLKFRTKFKAEPVHFTKKGLSYAFLGYDLSYFFIKAINQGGQEFVGKLSQSDTDDLLIPIHFLRNSSYGGFENCNLDLIKFNSDFSIDISDITKLNYEIDFNPPMSDSLNLDIF
ncbi:MAG: LysM peptidoglycan-binding domain-containing protein [Bacteroidales bacterium]|nr:LysM peptidoglycan-binding domain-containing protein [Bacteroidales bacterium]